MRLEAAVDRFVKESTSCRTTSSRTSARNRLGLLGRTFPNLELNEYRTEHLTQFCTMGVPAPGTVKARKSIVRSFFEWVTFMKLLERNPAADLKFTVKPAGAGVKHHLWLSEEEVAQVIQACPSDLHGRRARVVLLVGFMMGLRRAEIAGLRWRNFTTDLSRVSIVGKGNKPATLGVPPQVRAELQAWRSNCPVGCQTVLPNFSVNGFDELHCLWAKPIGAQTVFDITADAGARAGFPQLQPHDMRRSLAGILEARGVSIADISRLLRHSNVGITSIYLEKNPRKTAALADTFQLAL